MIKLQDFAKQQGVTDRAIQKHLKTYADELEGLYQRKGPNGTWLTDEACEILRGKMKQPPAPVIFEEDPRVKELEAEKADLQRQLNEANLNFQKYAANTAATLAEATKQLQLAERASSLEAENAVLSHDIAEKDKILEDERKNAQKALQELTEAHASFEKELEKRDKRIQELESRKWWQLIFRKEQKG